LSDLVRGYGELRRAVGASSGRHAVDEDAALTPIFHALRRGDVRRGEPAAPVRSEDEVADFRRDPLTAPIPVQAFAAAAAPSARRASTDRPARRRRAEAHPLPGEQRSGRHALLAG
jgi:hypothetical protein